MLAMVSSALIGPPSRHVAAQQDAPQAVRRAKAVVDEPGRAARVAAAASEIWTEWRYSVARPASVARVAAAPEDAKVAATVCLALRLTSIPAASADAALRSLGLADKSAHFFRAELDGLDYPASGREQARQEQDALAQAN